MTDTPLIVHRCTDFTVTGKGENPEWQKAQWVALNKIDKGGKEYESKFKILGYQKQYAECDNGLSPS
jgi:hypothetical protein